MTFRRATIAVGLAVAALAVTTPPTEAAASSLAPAANLTSPQVAGYLLGAPPASASASTTFVVPGLTCPSSGTLGIAPGAFVFTGSGTTANVSGAALFLVCQNGTTIYQAEAIVNGSGTVMSVSASKGDTIVSTVSVTASRLSVTFADTTKHFTRTVTGGGAKPAQVLVGVDTLQQGTTRLGVPNFKSLAFSNSIIDGKTLKAAGAKAVDMVSTARVLQIQTSALDVTGKKFTETFKHS